MDFIAFNTWLLLPFNQWYHKKIKNLTIECELLWNMNILKNDPPYCAFTQGQSPLMKELPK
jgi:hypothetical protein